jgi:hypothetical protein
MVFTCDGAKRSNSHIDKVKLFLLLYYRLQITIWVLQLPSSTARCRHSRRGGRREGLTTRVHLPVSARVTQASRADNPRDSPISHSVEKGGGERDSHHGPNSRRDFPLVGHQAADDMWDLPVSAKTHRSTRIRD